MAFVVLCGVCLWKHAGPLAEARAGNEPPSLRLTWGASGATLAGATSRREHAAILAAAHKAFGAERVVAAELEVAARRPSLVDLADLVAVAPGSVSGGRLEVEGETIRLGGAVASEEARTAVAEAVHAIAGPSFRLENDLVVAAAAVSAAASRPAASSPQPAPQAATGTPAPASTPHQPRQDLPSAIAALLADRPIEFALGSANLTARSRRTLDQLAPLLKRDRNTHILVASHTDLWGGTAHNRHLSQRRADAVVAYLVHKGIARRRFTAAGFGETRPITPGRTAADMARNRRIEIRVTKRR